MIFCCFGQKSNNDSNIRGTRENTVELVMLSRIKVAERELRDQDARESNSQSTNGIILGEHSPIIRESPCKNEMSREKGYIYKNITLPITIICLQSYL